MSEQPERAPLCPKCNQPMKLIEARDHKFWRCFTPFVWHQELFGIVGQDSRFKTKRLVDPVTMKIVNNPNFGARYRTTPGSDPVRRKRDGE